VAEEDVSFNILKWHYNYYPNSESKQWYTMGEGAYQVELFFEGKDMTITYTAEGKRLEEMVDLTKNVPVSVSYYLDEKYGKYKVIEFVKITTFDDDHTGFRLKLKSKDFGDDLISFDQNLVPVSGELLTNN